MRLTRTETTRACAQHTLTSSPPLPSSPQEALVGLCKRRGFIFPASEIYGGFANAYDYGPLGVELIRRVKESWWASTVRRTHVLGTSDGREATAAVSEDAARSRVVGLDSAIIQAPRVWEASGHAAGFSDPMVDCRECKARFRVEDDDGGETPTSSSTTSTPCCPACGSANVTAQRDFNLMFKTQLGALDAGSETGEGGRHAYLRPETAQGIFLNYKAVADSMRLAPPFGVAQIGKSFRNEITPGHFVFRTREFEQAEMEFFCRDESSATAWHAYWVEARWRWYINTMGISPQKLRLREQTADELAHYSSRCTDIEFEFPWGWGELEGVAIRGDYDLRKHAEGSGVDLRTLDSATGERYLPHVVEPAAGIGRIALALLVDAATVELSDPEEEGKGKRKGGRELFRFHPRVAPTTVAVLPLLKKKASGLPAMARAVEDVLRVACGDESGPPSALVHEALLGGGGGGDGASGIARAPPLPPQRFRADFVPTTTYDHTGAIGRRYRRYDEIGTPLCVTVDHATLEDEANRVVTVRSRDSMEQTSVPLRDLVEHIEEAIGAYAREE